MQVHTQALSLPATTMDVYWKDVKIHLFSIFPLSQGGKAKAFAASHIKLIYVLHLFPSFLLFQSALVLSGS